MAPSSVARGAKGDRTAGSSTPSEHEATTSDEPLAKGAYGVQLVRSDRLVLPPHPKQIAADGWLAWVNGLSAPKAVDLFCGAGGMSLGLEEAGYAVVLGVDHDPLAVETHAANFGGRTLAVDLGDPTTVKELCDLLGKVDDIDLIAGGPPCQPFSRAGRSKIRDLVRSGAREAHDDRRELWQAFVEVIRQVMPAAVLFENVPDMALQDDLSIVRGIAHTLHELGYETDFHLVDACAHGVPQFRQRFVLVAMRDGQPFVWPDSVAPVTLRDAISDLPPLRVGTGDRTTRYRRKPRSELQRWARRDMTNPNVVHDHLSRAVRDDDRKAFALMTSSTRYSDLPAELQRYRSDIFNDKYKKLSWTEPCRTITAHIAKDGYWYIHPEELRTLSVREAARVQTFPDRFRFAGTRSHAFTQIGNAVPPILARTLGSAILMAQARTSPIDGTRERERWAAIRGLLLQWSRRPEVAETWPLSGVPWRILVGTTMTAPGRGTKPTVTQFLERFPTPETVTGPKAHALSLLADSKQRADSVMALARTASLLASDDSWKGDSWARACGLTANEEQQVRTLGLGSDRMVITAGTTRVVARLTGAPEAQQRKLTDGRLALARLLGSGDEVTRVNAELVLLGAAICTASAPRCGQCPLRTLCDTAPTLPH